MSSIDYGYPGPVKGPDVPYFNPSKASNPVLRGLPLRIVAFLVSKFGFLAAFLWRNAGFDVLRGVKELNEYQPRYDPTVIPSNFRHIKDQQIENTSTADPGEAGIEGATSRHYSIADYHDAYRFGILTPTSVAHTMLDLVLPPSKYGTVFIDVRKEQLLAAAQASTKRFMEGKPLGILDGVPVAVKDEVDLFGCKKTLGSANDFTRDDGQTSWCVRKWEDAGAVIIGKLNMHEIGLDTTNNNTIHGTPPNPHSPHHYPGGSSGGSAAAVSLGLVPLALGADGGGSIRIPSSYCAVSGLKTTHGRISISPTQSIAPSVGVVGPMASSMADVAIGYSLMAAQDPDNPSSALFPPPMCGSNGRQDAQTSFKKVLGIYEPWFARADAPVLKICQRAIDRYKAAGWTVVPVEIPLLPLGQKAHALTILSEISAIASCTPTTSTRNGLPIFSSANKILLAVAKQTPAHDFLLAQKLRNLLMQHLSSLFQEHPGMIIVTPTTPNAGWAIEKGASELKGGVSDADMSLRSMEYVWLANFTGCPAISIPVGFTDEKVVDGKVSGESVKFPIGLMGMGNWGEEVGLLEWGREAEKFMRAAGGEDWRPKGEWVDIFNLAKGRGQEGRR